MENIFLLGFVLVIYWFVLRPIFIKPFKEGLNHKTIKKPTKKSFDNQRFNSESKDKGDKFEQYIVKKFDHGFFKVKEWRGDKYIDGIYAESSLNPDLELEFHLNDFSKTFAIECKFRQSIYDGHIQLAKERQITHYKKYEKERKIPVYITLGLGGKPESPAELFLIPLRDINENIISYKELYKFKKEIKSQFYFNMRDDSLN